MDANYWHNKWEQLDIRFHRSTPNPNLVTYADHFKTGKILLPLCGKSVDIRWLAERNYQVIGVELSEKAAKSFFEENQLLHTMEEDHGYKVFSASNVTIWCGDFFSLPDAVTSNLQGVYDRAALVALPKPMRMQYVSKLKKIFANNSQLKYLLVSFEYDQEKVAGPPFSVPEAEVREHFSDMFQVDLLDRHSGGELQSADKFSSTVLKECVYLMQSK